MDEFTGRCAIVTGAAQGLGRAVTTHLLERGAAVVGADILGEKLRAASDDLDAEKRGAFLPVPGDLRSADAASRLVDSAMSKFGRLDILVNCAGGSGHVAISQIDDMTDQAWDEVIDANLRATFLTCRAAVPQMRRAGYGRIVNFSSSLVRGQSGPLGTVGARLAYCAAKGGIEAFSRQLALDLSSTGITVNVIVPGFVLTEPGARVHDRFQALPATEREQMLGGKPIDSFALPRDVAEAVAFLVSDRTRHINGMAMPVGG